jgi:TetR/AcrR family fatty acid metabolism transcriptional regulator
MTDRSVVTEKNRTCAAMDKRQRIMVAAERLFKSRQFHEITMDEVAQVAGVGKGTLYLYFADKNDLFFQTAVSGFDDMCELLRRDAVTGGSIQQELQQACETICAFFQNRRPLFRMMQAEADRALGKGGSLQQRWNQHRKKMTQAVAEIIARGVRRREVRDDIDPKILAEYFLGMLRARSHELEGQCDSPAAKRALVDLFVHGLTGAARHRSHVLSGSAAAESTN